MVGMQKRIKLDYTCQARYAGVCDFSDFELFEEVLLGLLKINIFASIFNKTTLKIRKIRIQNIFFEIVIHFRAHEHLGF